MKESGSELVNVPSVAPLARATIARCMVAILKALYTYNIVVFRIMNISGTAILPGLNTHRISPLADFVRSQHPE